MITLCLDCGAEMQQSGERFSCPKCGHKGEQLTFDTIQPDPPTWVVTERGYAASLDLARRMGTAGAMDWAELKSPGTAILEPQERWIKDGWVEPAEGGQLTLF